MWVGTHALGMIDVHSDYARKELEPDTTEPEPIHTKHGLELVEHSLFYGYTEDEFEQLSPEQAAVLTMF